jgi:hypothetical protein
VHLPVAADGYSGFAGVAAPRQISRPHTMEIVLHKLLKRDDGSIQLLVSFGPNSVRAFMATYDGNDARCKICSVDEELFMRLSDLGLKRFGNCAVYHMELMGIISAFAVGRNVLDLPATLGTTEFCKLKPGIVRVLWNKLWILLTRMGLYHPRVWVHPDHQLPGRTGRCT